MQPNTKMSYCHVGFDLKAAREICIKLDLRYPARSLVDIDYQCALAAEMLPAALDEIERLQADIITHDDAWHNDRAANAKRIAELEEENRQLVRQIMTDDDKDRLITKQHTALKKLGQVKQERGKALVEERAKLFHQFGDMELDSSEDDRRMAREQLRREGKL